MRPRGRRRSSCCGPVASRRPALARRPSSSPTETPTRSSPRPTSRGLAMTCAGDGVADGRAGGRAGHGRRHLRRPRRHLAATTRVCRYDRAGVGLERGPRRRGDPDPWPGSSADALAAELESRGEAAPYVVLGWSYGGMVAQAFATRHADAHGRAGAGGLLGARAVRRPGVGATSTWSTAVGRSTWTRPSPSCRRSTSATLPVVVLSADELPGNGPPLAGTLPRPVGRLLEPDAVHVPRPAPPTRSTSRPRTWSRQPSSTWSRRSAPRRRWDRVRGGTTTSAAAASSPAGRPRTPRHPRARASAGSCRRAGRPGRARWPARARARPDGCRRSGRAALPA